MRINKKNHPQVYSEDCKYEIKKTQIPELKSDLDSDLDSDLEKIKAKINNELEPGYDCE